MYSKDGMRHHSASRAQLHDEVANARQVNNRTLKSPAGKHNPNPTAGGSNAVAGGPGSNDVSHMPIADVVAKHGPAHKVEITHDHAGGKHSVTSHHKGAHHKTEHESADKAHLHAADAVGLQTPDQSEEAEAEPYAGTESPEEEAAEEEQGGIPGMKRA